MRFYQIILALLLFFGQMATASDYVFFSTNEYDNLVQFWSPGDPYMPASKDGKWGYVGYDGKLSLVIPIIYDEAPYSFGYYYYYGLVRLGNEWQAIDERGNIKATFAEYDKVRPIRYSNKAFITKDGKMGLFDVANNQQLIETQYDDLWYFRDGFFTAKKDGKLGVIDENNNIKLPFVYDDISSMPCERCSELSLKWLDFIVVNKDGKVGLMEFETGREIFYVNYDGIVLQYENQPVLKVNKTNADGKKKYGIINYQGETIIPAVYDRINSLDGKASRFVVGRNSENTYYFGVIDDNNHIILPMEYEEHIEPLRYGKRFDDVAGFIVQKEGKFGVFDINGKMLLPMKYHSISDAYRMSDIFNEKYAKMGLKFGLDIKNRRRKSSQSNF